jgi:hypothetical protein
MGRDSKTVVKRFLYWIVFYVTTSWIAFGEVGDCVRATASPYCLVFISVWSTRHLDRRSGEIGSRYGLLMPQWVNSFI